MCSIFQLKAGVNIPYKFLENAVHNNEHGYGILYKEGGKLEIEKALPKKVDPEALAKKLKANDDVERWVHLRNMSEGGINDINVQPFELQWSKNNQLAFMHNGTISKFHLDDLRKTVELPLRDTASDSYVYAHQRLIPLLARFKANGGVLDLNDPLLTDIMNKYWMGGFGRAVIISGKREPFFIGSEKWINKKDPETGTEFLASNDDYFDAIKRGTKYEEDKKAAFELAEKKRKENPIEAGLTFHRGMASKVVSLITYPPFENIHSVSRDLKDILCEYELETSGGLIALGNLDSSEIKELMEKYPDDFITLFMKLTTHLRASLLDVEKTSIRANKLQRDLNLAKRDGFDVPTH